MKVWKERCYENDIPDEVPQRVSESMRVPSYKAIAMCILNNDLSLYGIGFAPHVSHWYRTVKQLNKKESDQMELFK